MNRARQTHASTSSAQQSVNQNKNRSLPQESIISIPPHEDAFGKLVHEIGRKVRVLMKKASTRQPPAIIAPFERLSSSAKVFCPSGLYPTPRRDFPDRNCSEYWIAPYKVSR
jgi:hypothetical protein